MTYLGIWGGIAGVFLLACLSPGPVWMIVTSTSVAVSRTAGILTGLGVAAATMTWATVAMLGAGLLAQLTWMTVAIKLVGAAYLVWVGLRTIAGARRAVSSTGREWGRLHGGWVAIRRGYISSMTNPKAAAFFGSIFVVMLPARAPAWVYAVTVILLFAVSAAWHCGLAVLFSTGPVQAGYRKAKTRIDTAVGLILIALGLRLAASR